VAYLLKQQQLKQQQRLLEEKQRQRVPEKVQQVAQLMEQPTKLLILSNCQLQGYSYSL